MTEKSIGAYSFPVFNRIKIAFHNPRSYLSTMCLNAGLSFDEALRGVRIGIGCVNGDLDSRVEDFYNKAVDYFARIDRNLTPTF